MSALLPTDMAMVLPLPVDRGCDGVVEFLDLSDCPNFFFLIGKAFVSPWEHLMRVFPLVAFLGVSGRLPVVNVGAFEATHVPSLEDFARLDPRFRLDSKVWEQLPQYHDYAFAVFKLRSGEGEVHPMGIRFATRLKNQLFFPTVHVHDEQVHLEERFGHQLFCQSSTDVTRHEDWKRSYWNLGGDIPRSTRLHSLLVRNARGYVRKVYGIQPNRDIIIGAAPLPDPT